MKETNRCVKDCIGFFLLRSDALPDHHGRVGEHNAGLPEGKPNAVLSGDRLRTLDWNRRFSSLAAGRPVYPDRPVFSCADIGLSPKTV